MRITLKLKHSVSYYYEFTMLPKQGDQIYLNSETERFLSLIGLDNDNFYVKRFHERFFKK